MNLGFRLIAMASMVIALSCSTLPPGARPAVVLLPPYVSSTLGAGAAREWAEVTAQAVASSDRYSLRTKGLFESGFDEALAVSDYSHTAVLKEAERLALVRTLHVDGIGLIDLVNDVQAGVYRLHFRIVDAATGFVREWFSAVLPWKPTPFDTWKKIVAGPGRPEVLTPPHPDRSGSWESWWSLMPPLAPGVEHWKASLDSARAEGNYDEALRLADLLLDQTPLPRELSTWQREKDVALEGNWIRGDAPWLRQFLARESQRAREDQDVEKLLAALAVPVGSPTQEQLLLQRFLDRIRETTGSHAGVRDEVWASFRTRFGQDLGVMLTRPPLVVVEGGTFVMGSDQGEADERPLHEVAVGSFLMGRTEVTQEQYRRMTGVNPSLFAQGADAPQRPVERVSWYDAVEYCIRLSAEDGLEPVYTLKERTPASGYPIKSTEVTQDRTKNGYRLPTEAEWEWAARGGIGARGTALAGGDNPASVAWTDGTGGPGPVAAKQPNELGLFDMSGNVWEWCGDWYGKYPPGTQSDPDGPTTGILKVGRGGSWHAAAWNARTTARSYDNPGSRGGNIGFRVVRTVSLGSVN